MSKLTKAQKQLVQEALVKRFVALIHAETTADPLYEEVAGALMVPFSALDDHSLAYADRVLQSAKSWLTRLPEVA